MNLRTASRVMVSMASTALLVLALLFVRNAASSPEVHARGVAWFVSPRGSGEACTQSDPCGLQTAVAQASDGDMIFLAVGTYTGTEAAVISISQGIALYGGWDGSTATPVVRDPIAYPSTLDGEGQRRVVYAGSNITVTLEGLTVTNGMVTDQGAGLYAREVYLTLRHTTFYSNVADSLTNTNTFGAGAYLQGGDVHLISSTFRANDAWCFWCPTSQGGGLYIYGSVTATIEDSLFEANDAWIGAGLMFDGGSRRPIFIRRTIFKDNGCGLDPGGGWAGHGAGAYMTLADATVEDCAFTHNKAANAAGALYFSAYQLSIDRTAVSDNIAYVAPGIEIWNTSPFTLTNNMIVDNQPGYDWEGGVSIRGASGGALLHNTIARNVGYYGGYGIEVRSALSITLVNTILVSHTVGISAAAGSAVTLDGTLWGTGDWANTMDWAGAGNIVTGTVNVWGDPDFLDPDGGNYHLRSASDAMDAGVDAGIATDIDGERRPFGLGCDIGADEVQQPPATRTPTPLPTPTRSATPTGTATATPTRSATPSATSATTTPAPTTTPTATGTATAAPTGTHTATRTATLTGTAPPTRTPTASPTLPGMHRLYLPLVLRMAPPRPTATWTPTHTPTATATFRPLCTPPACGPGEALYCPDVCPGGCGYRCATPIPPPQTSTPTRTRAPTVTATRTRAPTPTVTMP